jgi:hypothetical protein
MYLNDQTNIFIRSLKENGHFSVSSMYQAMIDSHFVPHNSYLCKIRRPLKNKVFMWLLYRETILIKDNLVKRI